MPVIRVLTPTDPWLAQESGSKLWRLCESWQLWFSFDGVNHEITIPQGYLTDRATVPDVLAPLVSKDDLGVPGPLVHDALCLSRGNLRDHCYPPRTFTSDEAADLFLAICLADDVMPWRAKLAAFCVRTFGPRF
jgi:hypothetical protein